MDASKAINALKEALPGSHLALPGTEEYETLNTGTYMSGLCIDITPGAIFQPKSKDEVAAFVRTIKPFVASGDAAFAIVGGGRQPAPGCSNIQDGITLNLGLLKGVEVKDDVVSIGAGEQWGEVYDKLAPLGLGVSGSRSSKGGIAGLALAGGLSFNSSRQGFICDDVVNYEVVLASGDIVNANADEHADLWRALRGGGNNFGVVTRFDMKTFKQGPLYGGSVFYFGPNFPGQIEALVSEVQKPDADPETHLMISLGYTAMLGTEVMAMNQLYHMGGIEEPAVLEPFTSIQPQIDQLNSLRVIQNLADASREQTGDIPALQRSAYMNLTVKADVATLVAGSETFKAALEPVKGLEGLVCSYTLQPYARSLLEASASKGGNSLGLHPSHGPVISVAYLMYWKNKDDDEKILGAFRGALEKTTEDAKSRGTFIDFTYMNYSYTFQDPIGSYGAANKKSLQEASRKYDPEGIFQKGVPGGWKLFT
ncbi:hypothetical protein SLS62_008254 [Diatrype stigma]|uniref:FAD-binding PCMH-type domain-containing protein n=1 Tax=Diatrype stigma TaxID=117547 RepID=A0AAN9YP62_9PEZI